MKTRLRFVGSFGFLLFLLLFSCLRENHAPQTRPLVDTLRFIAFGDWGEGGNDIQKSLASAMDRLASRKRIDFIVTLGDNFYPVGVASENDPQFQSTFENIYGGTLKSIPWFVTLGNHDYEGNPDAQIGYSQKSFRWKLPARYYSTDFNISGGVVRMVVLDTSPFERTYYTNETFRNKVNPDTTRQKIWMDSIFSLKGAQWVFVTGHHPVFSGGQHAPELGGMRHSLVPFFEKYKVPVYLAGHEHDLQHLKLSQYDVQQFISGTASQTRSTTSVTGTLYASSEPAFLLVEVTTSVMKFTFLDAQLNTLYTSQIIK